jgi:2'-5' RNA ligase
MNRIEPSSRRLFVGIPVTKEQCPKFFSWTRNLIRESSEAGWNVRWSKPENYHITLSFLGDSPHHDLEKIISTLRSGSHMPFWIQIQNMGIFLNGKHSNILWAGIESRGIETFQNNIHDLMKNIGYSREIKPFNPHITLGRMKQIEDDVQGQSISTVLDQFRVTKFCLFESFFSQLKVEYRILETFDCK